MGQRNEEGLKLMAFDGVGPGGGFGMVLGAKGGGCKCRQGRKGHVVPCRLARNALDDGCKRARSDRADILLVGGMFLLAAIQVRVLGESMSQRGGEGGLSKEEGKLCKA